MLTSQRPPGTETELGALLAGTREAARIGGMRCFDARESRQADYSIGAYVGDFGKSSRQQEYIVG